MTGCEAVSSTGRPVPSRPVPSASMRKELCLHREVVGENHHGLNEVFNSPDSPSVLALPGLISTHRLARQRVPTPDDRLRVSEPEMQIVLV